MLRGEADDADQRLLSRYAQRSQAQGGRPRWIPKGTAYDVVAALSQLSRPPDRWTRVELQPAPQGQPWTMTVHYDRGYAESIQVPGGGADGTGARELLDLLEGDQFPDDVDVHES
jgi:hypothetical protein